VTPTERYERLVDLSPSAKLVYKVLELESPLSPGQIADRSRLPERTVRHALSVLGEESLITEEISFRDARRKRYAARPVADPDED